MPLDHLRLGRPAHIDPVERIEHEIGMVARRADTDDDRVERAEILGGNKNQLAGSLRPPEPRRGKSGKARAGGFEQVSSVYNRLLPASVSQRC
jgi:hypothetical protein